MINRTNRIVAAAVAISPKYSTPIDPASEGDDGAPSMISAVGMSSIDPSNKPVAENDNVDIGGHSLVTMVPTA